MAETYEEWIERQTAPKPKTTDDCYTPAEVYEKIVQYCEKRYGIDRAKIIRPFYPGGDYQAEYYTGKIVIDNPPFSIMKQILQFYDSHDIPFFLFCSGLMSPIYRTGKPLYGALIVVASSITYSNGAKVSTSFITNLEPTCIRTDSELAGMLEEPKPRKKIKKPDNWIQVTDLKWLQKRREDIRIDPADIVKYHSHTPSGQSAFGCYFELTPEKMEEYLDKRKKAEENWEKIQEEKRGNVLWL